jgi:hypothetical protein
MTSFTPEQKEEIRTIVENTILDLITYLKDGINQSAKDTPQPKPQAKPLGTPLAPYEAIQFEGILKELVKIERKDSLAFVTPIKFMGSENFAKVNAKVKEFNGGYVSAGKNSHWEIPIKE